MKTIYLNELTEKIIKLKNVFYNYSGWVSSERLLDLLITKDVLCFLLSCVVMVRENKGYSIRNVM